MHTQTLTHIQSHTHSPYTHSYNPHHTLIHRYTHTHRRTHLPSLTHSHTCTRRDTPSLAPSTHTDTYTNTQQLTHMHAQTPTLMLTHTHRQRPGPWGWRADPAGSSPCLVCSQGQAVTLTPGRCRAHSGPQEEPERAQGPLWSGDGLGWCRRGCPSLSGGGGLGRRSLCWAGGSRGRLPEEPRTAAVVSLEKRPRQRNNAAEGASSRHDWAHTPRRSCDCSLPRPGGSPHSEWM